MPNQFGLIQFKDYLVSKTGNAGNPASVSIKAADLDNNFQRLTPIKSNGNQFFKFTKNGMIPESYDLNICIDGKIEILTVIGILKK